MYNFYKPCTLGAGSFLKGTFTLHGSPFGLLWKFCQLPEFKVNLLAFSNGIICPASCSHDIELLVYAHVPKYVSTFNNPAVNDNVH